MSGPLPALPQGQRWAVERGLGGFLIVRLQERRWWGWRTIARSTAWESGGRAALNQCVEHILRRDYYDRLRAEYEAEKQRRVAEIPYGYH